MVSLSTSQGHRWQSFKFLSNYRFSCRSSWRFTCRISCRFSCRFTCRFSCRWKFALSFWRHGQNETNSAYRCLAKSFICSCGRDWSYCPLCRRSVILSFCDLGLCRAWNSILFLDVIVLLSCSDSILDWLRAWFGKVVFARARHLESNRFRVLGVRLLPHIGGKSAEELPVS